MQLDPAAAETAWAWYRTSSFISCPVQTSIGRTLGVLALSCAPPRPPLGPEQLRVTEVFAGLAALALERTELLEREARRAEAEELLNQAARKMAASLDLDVVYRRSSSRPRGWRRRRRRCCCASTASRRRLRCVASVGATERLISHRYAWTRG